MNAKDKELYKKFNAYFKDALNLLHKTAQGKKISLDVEQCIEFEIEENPPEGHKRVGYSLPYTTKLNYSKLIFDNWDDLEKLESHKEYIKYLEDNNYTARNVSSRVFAKNLLFAYVEEVNDLNFIEEKVNRIYKKIEDFIFSDEIKFSCSARLHGFQSDVDEISIDKDIKIKRYTDEECKQIWKRSFISRSLTNVINPLDFKIEDIFSKKKEDVNRSSSSDEQRLKKTLLLLRLFKPSTLRIGIIETKPIQWVPMGGVLSSGITEDIHLGGSYKLNKTEIPQLIKLWDVIKNISFSHCPSLEIAIHRFGYAHQRENLEDRLIDIMIGFETLFLDDNKELAYKSSLRVATLLGENFGDKKQIFEIMKKAYNKRSELVHKGRLDKKIYTPEPVGKEFNMEKFVGVLKNYLSESITKFAQFSSKYTHKQIIEEIHQNTLKSDLNLWAIRSVTERLRYTIGAKDQKGLQFISYNVWTLIYISETLMNKMENCERYIKIIQDYLKSKSIIVQGLLKEDLDDKNDKSLIYISYAIEKFNSNSKLEQKIKLLASDRGNKDNKNDIKRNYYNQLVRRKSAIMTQMVG